MAAGLLLLLAGAAWWTTGAGATWVGLAASLVLGTVGLTLLLARAPRLAGLATAAAGGAVAVVFGLALHGHLRGERPYEGRGLAAALPSDGLAVRPTVGAAPAFPAAGGEPLRLIAWGDCRGGVTVFERLLDAVRARRPHAVVGLGDFVGMARVHAFEVLRDKIQGTGVPTWLVPGNHDLDPWDALGPYGEVLGAGGWAFVARDVLVVGLDSARGKLTTSEADRLERLVAEAGASARHLVVCVHHPLWAPPGREDKPLPQDAPETRRVQAVCEARGALVLCSHWHGYDRSSIGRATQVVTGGAGSRLEADHPYHFLGIEFGDAGPTIERVDLAPADFDTEGIDKLKTFRDEASWAARELPLRTLAPWAGLVALLAGLVTALRPRSRRPA